MNIKILDSWLRDYLKTEATPKDFAQAMSLTSVSIERMEKHGDDVIYDIEVTTNRPDLMSVVGLAREASAVLPQFGHRAEFVPPKLIKPSAPEESKGEFPLSVKNNDKLVNRVLAVVMEVEMGQSPKEIQERLETSNIRSLNSIIDVTNYVMRTIGHPTHVFDYDRLKLKTIAVRESHSGEHIKTLDGKEYKLTGDDIVADDGVGNIIDLLGVMGLENSVVTDETKRIVYFIDNVDPYRIRKTSMQHGIRTEAAQLNEKNIDSEAAYEAMLYGIELYKQIANGKLLTDIIDIYPHKEKTKHISVSLEQITKVMGITVPQKTVLQILSDLGFAPGIENGIITTSVPSYRSHDIEIPEDIIEEVARVYGYHNIPNSLPHVSETELTQVDDEFYFEQRVKEAMKYWGWTEVYTYPLVSEEMFEGPLEQAVTLANPLGEEFAHLRRTLVPSLLQIVNENKQAETIRIFEIANVYHKRNNDLPDEIRTFAGLIKYPKANFYEVKGVLEQLFTDLGVKNVVFKPSKEAVVGADVYLINHPSTSSGNNLSLSGASAKSKGEFLGTIEVLDDTTINFELDFGLLVNKATTKKTYTPISKYPEVFEDISLIIDDKVLTGDIIDEVKKQSSLITDVSLLDKYEDTRTFHIVYHSDEKSLTGNEVGEIRSKILKTMREKFNASVK